MALGTSGQYNLYSSLLVVQALAKLNWIMSACRWPRLWKT